MTVLVLNGSPRKNGSVARLLREMITQAPEGASVEWVDVADLKVAACTGCMACRPDGECVLTRDDGHRLALALREADCILVGTPTYWANMSGQLKALLDRCVPSIMGETQRGLPLPRLRGVVAAVVATSTTPWPLNIMLHQSRGAVRAVTEVLRAGGCTIRGRLEVGGTRTQTGLPAAAINRARAIGARIFAAS